MNGSQIWILEAVPGRWPKNALAFFRGYQFHLQFYHQLVREPVDNILSRFYHTGPPSATINEPRVTDHRETGVMCLLHRWIVSADTDTEIFGAGNFFFACLEGLLRMHMTVSLPPDITINSQVRTHKMWHQGHRSELVQPSADGRHLWVELWTRLDIRRMIQLRLPDFVEINFDVAQKELDTHFKKVRQKFQRCVTEDEIEEAKLKDCVDIINSQKATEMAERSIAESRRAMFVSILAFIFLPLSLAASIYGTNV